MSNLGSIHFLAPAIDFSAAARLIQASTFYYSSLCGAMSSAYSTFFGLMAAMALGSLSLASAVQLEAHSSGPDAAVASAIVRAKGIDSNSEHAFVKAVLSEVWTGQINRGGCIGYVAVYLLDGFVSICGFPHARIGPLW